MVPAMPIISPIPINPLIDGRQSERAMLVRRGVQRLLAEMGAHVLPELSLATGRRADLVALTR
ncbi:MAG: MmcB family DNA repair protein, partial [Mesorhizobium sp.]